MNLINNQACLSLWREAIKSAEKRCSIALKADLETYLVSLLAQYTDKPEIAKQILATAFLESQQLQEQQRKLSLREVGDQCLIFAGLFPRVAEKRLVKISYFVGLGQTAYHAISQTANDLYSSLAIQFVVLMDVLQSIRPSHDLLPLEAYEQWESVGSQRALRILQEYTNGIPTKFYRQ